MNEFEKKLREMVGDNDNSIPTYVLFSSFVLGTYFAIVSVINDLKKGNEKND